MAAAAVLPLLLAAIARTAAASPADDVREAFRLGAAEFPQDDAIILRLEQAWTLGADGACQYEEHVWTKVLSPRVYGSLGDVRIDHREGVEALEIVAARTQLADGRTIEAPGYARNVVSPGGDTSGWPAYGDLRQTVVSFSGVEVGAVLELHFVRTTRAGVRPWLWGDVRVQEAYPVVSRTVAVTAPATQAIHHRLENVIGRNTVSAKAGVHTYVWEFRDLGRCEDEPQAPPANQRCGRLRFTTCAGAAKWAGELLRGVEQSAVADEAITKLARDAAEKEIDAAGRVRAVGEALGKSFNFVESRSAWSGRGVRPAAEVFRANYGSAPESAALWLAALRAAGLTATPMIAVVSAEFADEVPVDSALEAVVLEVETGEGLIYVHPRQGAVMPFGAWAERTLLGIAGDGTMRRVALAGAGAGAASSVRARVELVLKEDGSAAGDIRVHLSGLFVDAAALRDNDKKTQAVGALLGRLLPGFKVEQLRSSELSAETFRAEAKIGAKEPLAAVAGGRLMTLGEQPLLLEKVPLPLRPTQRTLAVQLAGAAVEEVELRVEYPAGWRPTTMPAAQPSVVGTWGRLEQSVETADNALSLSRTIELRGARIEAGDFDAVRRAVDRLRGDVCRVLIVGPGE